MAEITAEVEIKAEMESMAKTETVVEVDTMVEGKAKMEQQEKKCMQLRLQALKPEITQICWQDGLRYLQLQWFLQ